jgi:hypothetical protein
LGAIPHSILKIKVMKTDVKSKINKLLESEKLVFTFREVEYAICCFWICSDGEKSFSISINKVFGKSMNVSKITNQFISLFDYNMMGGKSKYKMDISEIIWK